MTLQPGHPVRLSVIGEAEPPLEATVENVSGSGVRLGAGRPLKPGAAVRLDLEEALYLGEVCYCAPQGLRYVIGVELQHSLLHLPSLERLVQRLCGEDSNPEREPQPARLDRPNSVPDRDRKFD